MNVASSVQNLQRLQYLPPHFKSNSYFFLGIEVTSRLEVIKTDSHVFHMNLCKNVCNFNWVDCCKAFVMLFDNREILFAFFLVRLILFLQLRFFFLLWLENVAFWRLQGSYYLLNLEFLDEWSKPVWIKTDLLNDTQLSRAWTKPLKYLRLHRLQMLSF